jgi:phosphoesterase RecJ-like protein
MKAEFTEIAEIIRQKDRFLLVTHVNPDGDGIGSEIALHRFLKRLGKTSTIVNGHPAPVNFHFLDPKAEVQVYNPSIHQSLASSVDVIFILDISNRDRLGRCGAVVRSSNALTICIDHHISNDKSADVNLIDVEASSTGELIYRLISVMDGEITLDIAEPLYVSLITDTGSFRFSNTNSIAHSIAAHLVEVGVRPRDIYESLYENSSIGRIKLLGFALAELKSAADGRIAWSKITMEMMRATNTRPQECEGFVDYLRLLKDVEVCLLFIELEGGKTKVSLRSRGTVDVNKIAGEFGGGGHQHAAGLFVETAVEQLEHALIHRTERSLSLSV